MSEELAEELSKVINRSVEELTGRILRIAERHRQRALREASGKKGSPSRGRLPMQKKVVKKEDDESESSESE